jgi:hypothetical protein
MLARVLASQLQLLPIGVTYTLSRTPNQAALLASAPALFADFLSKACAASCASGGQRDGWGAGPTKQQVQVRHGAVRIAVCAAPISAQAT